MFKQIRYRNEKYCIMTVYFKKHKVPVLLNVCDEQLVKQVSEKWKCHSSGIVSCLYEYNENMYEIKLHELIMLYHHQDEKEKYQNKSVFHINKMKLDNRIENLSYDKKNEITIKKKKRILNLPEETDICPDEIPTYVWYNKPDMTHGERFVVKIKDIYWKTTSSKKLSLRYKLEEAKTYLRQLKKTTPEVFKEYSMNGDYSKTGERLLNSFYNIIDKAKFTSIKKIILPQLTKKYLQHHQINNSDEKKLFRNILKNEKIRNIKLPKNINNLPEHCYYRPKTNKRGEYFLIRNHPKYSKTWTSSSSKKLSLDDKYKQLLLFLNSLN